MVNAKKKTQNGKHIQIPFARLAFCSIRKYSTGQHSTQEYMAND
jgi:hypothetical protein